MASANKSIPFVVPPQSFVTQRPHRRTKMAFLSTDEVLAVLKAARERSSRDWAMILLAYRHGLRASEVCNLKLSDADPQNLALTQGSFPRRSAARSIAMPLLDEVKAIRSWLSVRVEDGSGYLFLSQKGGPLSRVQFFRIFQSIAASIGLPADKRHPHCLKHSLASHLIAGNVNLALVRQALGHRSINSTMVYIGTSDSQAAEAAHAALMKIF
jgi:integrase